jgi:hypothetical protein
MNMHDFKSRHQSNRPESCHPSLAECLAWGVACFAIWIAAFALAAHQLGGF